MFIFLGTQFTRVRLLFFLSLFLLVVFMLHGFGIKHEHHHEPQGEGDELGVYLHGGDKKWWTAILLVAVAAPYAIGRVLFSEDAKVLLGYVFSLIAAEKLFSPLSILLREGVLHPKLY